MKRKEAEKVTEAEVKVEETKEPEVEEEEEVEMETKKSKGWIIGGIAAAVVGVGAITAALIHSSKSKNEETFDPDDFEEDDYDDFYEEESLDVVDDANKEAANESETKSK